MGGHRSKRVLDEHQIAITVRAPEVQPNRMSPGEKVTEHSEIASTTIWSDLKCKFFPLFSVYENHWGGSSIQ